MASGSSNPPFSSSASAPGVSRFVIHPGANVSINNGARSCQVNRPKGPGVVVTPVLPGSLIDKILVRVLNQTVPKKDPTTFTLRNINTAVINTPQLLKCEIRKQDIVDADFEVGYVYSSTLVT